jgi:predicted NBD/HSP70 family sugar kinase
MGGRRRFQTQVRKFHNIHSAAVADALIAQELAHEASSGSELAAEARAALPAAKAALADFTRQLRAAPADPATVANLKAEIVLARASVELLERMAQA